jgi:hypothetical protein
MGSGKCLASVEPDLGAPSHLSDDAFIEGKPESCAETEAKAVLAEPLENAGEVRRY